MLVEFLNWGKAASLWERYVVRGGRFRLARSFARASNGVL